MFVDVLKIGSIFFFAFGFQAAVGFGGGLISIPILLLAGFDLPQVVAMSVIAALSNSILGARSLRQDIPWNYLLLPISARTIGLLLGTAGLVVLTSQMDKRSMEALVGVLILAMLGCRFLTGRGKETAPSRLYTATLLGGSGICLGLIGVGGPLAVLWATAHQWSSERIRGVLFSLYLPGLMFQIVLLSFIFGAHIKDAAILSFLAVPFCLLGSLLGLRLGKMLSGPRLTAVAYCFLMVISLNSIFAVL